MCRVLEVCSASSSCASASISSLLRYPTNGAGSLGGMNTSTNGKALLERAVRLDADHAAHQRDDAVGPLLL
jgi:hypothetical protein